MFPWPYRRLFLFKRSVSPVEQVCVYRHFAQTLCISQETLYSFKLQLVLQYSNITIAVSTQTKYKMFYGLKNLPYPHMCTIPEHPRKFALQLLHVSLRVRRIRQFFSRLSRNDVLLPILVYYYIYIKIDAASDSTPLHKLLVPHRQSRVEKTR